ncbi:MAG: hypothetical protein Q4C56_06900 [Peptococcaceae bacterium]|nr:hypothetical protein [Peptococcaceae bacterium]
MTIRQNELGRIGQNRYYGSFGPSAFYEEFLPELYGSRGVAAYTEMADNDATVGAILFAIEMLMRNVDFTIEPAGNSDADKAAAEFVEECMNDMERTWADTLSEMLSFLTYGWSYHEIVYKRRGGRSGSAVTASKYDDGLIGWRKLPIRAQDTLYGWEYKDDTDELVGMVQIAPPNFTQVMIPLEKALHFRTRSKKDNPEGRSILRTAYRAHYFKKRIEEIEGYGIERDLAGFPVLYAPADFPIWDSDDPEMRQVLAKAEAIVSSVRRDAREGLVLPGGENGWKLELITSGSRRQFDTNAIIDRYDKRIATSVLADFVMLGQQQVGSFALADSKTKIFALAIGTYLNSICEVFNNQAIPRLIDINGDAFAGISDYPRMVHGDIETPDLDQFTNFVTSMVGAGIVQPDEQLEAEVRRVGGLPERVETATPSVDEAGQTQQGATDMKQDKLYKITSVIGKYQNGSITRDMAVDLLEEIGIEQSRIDFYLRESDAAQKSRRLPGDTVDAAEARIAKAALGRQD